VAEQILITSLVGYKTGQPIVQLEWGDKKAQLTAEEARAHAFRVLECADAAESDLFLWEFATTTIGVTTDGAAKLMQEFREFRERRRPDASRS
jgi:hypothetical protein